MWRCAGIAASRSATRALSPINFLYNLLLSLDSGATFVTGSIATLEGASPSAAGSGGNRVIELLPPTTEMYLGNPFALSGLSDWTINLNGLAAGDTFTLTAQAVDEPAGVALLLAALTAAGLARRRRA